MPNRDDRPARSAVQKRTPIEFFIIRYVPDVVKGEFINVGIILREFQPQDLEVLCPIQVRVTRDWSRVRAVSPRADFQLLGLLEDQLTVLCREGNELTGSASDGGADPIAMMLETFSNSIQLSDRKVSLAESVDLELDRLMLTYVAPLVPTYSPGKTGRVFLLANIRRSFEQANVWDRMNISFPARSFTGSDDPLTLDCSYTASVRDGQGPGGTIVRIYQAVSLLESADAAKALAYSAASLRLGALNFLGADLRLTAVVEDFQSLLDFIEPEADLEPYHRFMVTAMETAGIQVITIAGLEQAKNLALHELAL